ncbi:MAG: lipopolysaccharide biosynthesis protein [Jatrophihabitantaceae bacterium]
MAVATSAKKAGAHRRPKVAATDRALGQRIRRGAMWSAASTLIMRFANISIMAVVARTLAPRDFGVFAVAMTVHAIVSSIAELGVASCLVRADVDLDELAPTVAAVSLISSTALAGGMYAFARPLSSALGSSDAAGPMRVMAIAVLLVGVFAVPGANLAREFRQDKQFLANIGGFIAANSLLLVLATHGGGALSFAWSRVVGQFVIGTVMTMLVDRRYRPALATKHLRFVLGFGLPLAGANLLNFALLNTDYVFIGHLLGPVELGVYMLAFNISSWPSSLMSTMLNSIAMPAFSRVKHDVALLEAALVRAATALAFVALPVCALTATLAHPLVRTIYGDRWNNAADVLAVLAVYGAISVLCLLFANALSGLGQTRLLLIAQFPWIGCLVPAMAIGVHVNGIVGAAWAHIVVVCLVALPFYLYMLKRSAPIRITAIARGVAPVLAAALLAAGTATLVAHALPGPALQLLGGGSAGSVVYLLFAVPIAQDVLGIGRLIPKRLAGPINGYVRQVQRFGVGVPAMGDNHSRERPSHRRSP